MLKHIFLLTLVVALVMCRRGGGAKNKAKNKAKESALDSAREQLDSVDTGAAKDKAKGKVGGKNLSKKKLLSMTTDHLPTGIHLPEGKRKLSLLFPIVMNS